MDNKYVHKYILNYLANREERGKLIIIFVDLKAVFDGKRGLLIREMIGRRGDKGGNSEKSEGSVEGNKKQDEGGGEVGEVF